MKRCNHLADVVFLKVGATDTELRLHQGFAAILETIVQQEAVQRSCNRRRL